MRMGSNCIVALFPYTGQQNLSLHLLHILCDNLVIYNWINQLSNTTIWWLDMFIT